MATIGDLNPTITDVQKTLDQDGSAASIIELLKEHNEILDDITYIEGNETDGHRVTVQTGLPSGIWRAYNQGIPSSKATTAQVKEVNAQRAQRLAVDVDLANKQANREQFLLFQANSHLEALNQDVVEAMFYSNAELNPGQPMGFAPRYSDLGAVNGEMVIDAGGTGAADNASIWLMGWSPTGAFAFYPRGSQSGVRRENLPDAEELDADNNPFLAHIRVFKWDIGFGLADWRYAGRIANIPPSVAVDPTPAAADNLIIQMTRLSERVADLQGRARWAFYMPRKLREAVRIQALHTKNLRFSYEDIAGRRSLAFDGIPVRRVDRLLDTEARVLDSTET